MPKTSLHAVLGGGIPGGGSAAPGHRVCRGQCPMARLGTAGTWGGGVGVCLRGSHHPKVMNLPLQLLEINVLL